VIGLAASFLVAMAVTTLTTPWVIRLATRWGVMAIPRDRDVHVVPTPRWGGIAIYAGVIVAVVLAVSYRHWRTDGANGWSWHLAGLLLAASWVALTGMLDDVKDLKPIWQIGAIAVAAILLVAFGVRIEGVTRPFVESAGGSYDPARWIPLSLPVSVLVTVFWVLLVTKTVDAIDGLDGLAAGVCAISSATLALLAAASRQAGGPTIALVAAAVAGACIGFLRYNYNPAKVFMSTVGAQFLGLMLAGISIMGTFKVAAAVSVLLPILVLGVPIFDFGVVVLKRAMNRVPLTVGDRRHIHHRLLDRGLTHRQAVWVIYACTLALCIAAVVLFNVSR
jgi:UDP-GlcNAc:undecaprenyl-phosphate GlcNAc-1-phosphate transferase